ncbi:Ribosomal RNA small subunit methyltransferase H [Geodia barretti]|uniref:Ribosomal RNA small subunit methyltransferase H n=1 Tax=Geodia barretti TaxID=519541 RepID=A0AA35TRR3_GEOBA|nr:Ribosomal RNA small subunit methyltransferase H [Geodia barretti]
MADQAEGVIVPFHLPVLLTEVLGQLGVRPGGVYVDGTVGDGGHALAFLRASAPLGSVCGIDLDPRSLVRTEQRLAPFGVQFTPILGSYAEMVSLVQGMLGSEARADGVLLDLGISSRQVDGSGFGFSFQQDEPLDMRFNPEADIPTAADIVNTWSREGLVAVLREYGEEPRAGAIASAIVRQRPISSTVQLASVVAGAAGRQSGTSRTHPATRTFQALRIAVNDELNTLTTGLQAAVDLLAPSGRLAVISYHSLEDRRVKTFLAREAAQCICPPRLPVCVCQHQPRVSLVNRRIIRPSAGEIAENPRSRSARMRVAQRLAE